MISEEWDLFMNLKNRKTILFAIFTLAILLRFIYFPQNTYFGFDQARDAYAVRDILRGDLKIIGPPTAAGVINHGVLYYYIFTPFYFFSDGDPTLVSIFLRMLNAAGIFLVFLITLPMFGEVAALLAAFLFAISYEQTQFSLFFNHPALAVISVLIFYLGLSTWIFRKKYWGVILSFFGLGLSIQFEFVETQLIAILALFTLVFKKQMPDLNFKKVGLILITLAIPLASYIISEVKNNFPLIKNFPNLLVSSQNLNLGNSLHFFIINRHIHDNFIAGSAVFTSIYAVLFLLALIKLLLRNDHRKELTFLTLWFFGGLLVYFVNKNDAYFYNTGTAISLLIFIGFLLYKTYSKSRILTISLLLLIFISNTYLVFKNNQLGPNQRINPQIGLLLKDEQKVLDFIYQSAKGEEFAINALTMPYNVNTTWSYLFEWYGMKKYGYVPVWGGDAAEGYPGNLKVEKARSNLPQKRFLIIEPQEGIPAYLRDSFIANEENYSKVLEKKKIGTIEVWIQQAK